MFISNMTDRGATPALVNTLVFNQAKLSMIAENVANWQTPGYKVKRLDTRSFQHALGRALDQRGSNPSKPFVIPGHSQFRQEDDGRLKLTPTEKPVENILSHNGTNLSIERQMSELAETRMRHELAATMLKGRFEGLRKAIRGRV